MYTCMSEYVHMYGHGSEVTQRLGKDVTSHGAEATGSCKWPDVGTGN